MACFEARREIHRLLLYKRQIRDYRLACRKYFFKEGLVYALNVVGTQGKEGGDAVLLDHVGLIEVAVERIPCPPTPESMMSFFMALLVSFFAC